MDAATLHYWLWSLGILSAVAAMAVVTNWEALAALWRDRRPAGPAARQGAPDLSQPVR